MPVIPPKASWREPMRDLYDDYFASHDYEVRYPRPNEGTWAFLRRGGILQSRHLLDLGCGNGRYAVPLLQAGRMHLVACDISQSAIEQLDLRLKGLGMRDRAQLHVGELASLPADHSFDAVVMMFGVLSHLGLRDQRLQALRDLRGRMTPSGLLALSVPCIWRRRPLEILRAWWRAPGRSPEDIAFQRRIAGQIRTFYYHLYSPRTLRQELAETGWTIRALEAESLLPEWLVTQSPRWSRLDTTLAAHIPAALGYGIRVLAQAS